MIELITTTSVSLIINKETHFLFIYKLRLIFVENIFGVNYILEQQQHHTYIHVATLFICSDINNEMS